jgi:hypothetical protein
MKMSLFTSLIAVALSSSVAFANGEYHHRHHHVAYSRSENVSDQYYDLYRPAPSATPAYTDPFGTYSVLPSPVSDQ